MSFNFIKSCYMLKFIFINNNLLTKSAASLRAVHCALVFIFTYENIRSFTFHCMLYRPL